MPFTPEILADLNNINVWIRRQFRHYDAHRTSENLIPLFTAAPTNPQEGQIVRADGASWNPGSGRGFYGYDNGSWTFLG